MGVSMCFGIGDDLLMRDRKLQRLDAVSTWGDGPDVLVVVDWEKTPTYYLDLTSQQALKLAKDLVEAATTSLSMDIKCIQDELNYAQKEEFNG